MKYRHYCIAAILAGGLCIPAFATVQIESITPSLASPQKIGTSITWTITATDTNPGPLAFRFRVALKGRRPAAFWDFNLGTLNSGTWTSPQYTWTPTGPEGAWHIEVMVKDFKSGETAQSAIGYRVTPLVTGQRPAVAATANPLVALFSAPACAGGSTMRVVFAPLSGSSPASATNWEPCDPGLTMSFEIAGMYPSMKYRMFWQTKTGGSIVRGRVADFTTGALPTEIQFPSFTTIVPPGVLTDTADSMILWSDTSLGNPTTYPDVATDLSANIKWYYLPLDSDHTNRLTRPLRGGHFLSIEDGPAWNPASTSMQLLRELDLAGNIVRETNTGILQQELLALGAKDAGPCTAFGHPAPIGSACLGSFHHEAIETLPNGGLAVMTDIEQIFPPRTQADGSGLPVDVIGDMIVVLDSDWQASWYFDAFEHDNGPPQLEITRAAVLAETCSLGEQGCPPMFLLGNGISTLAKDWLHGNSIYYWPQTHDLIWSSKDQDWIMKVDYQDGAGTGNILWRMGLDGEFTLNNTTHDVYPWFSHQHDAGIENDGAGVMTLYDNGDTRVTMLGANCGPADCYSRGMALNFNETTMQVTPVLIAPLGALYGPSNGSAQLLSNGNYFFNAAFVASGGTDHGYAIEIGPDDVMPLEIKGPNTYRAWQIPNMYDPPIT